MFISTFSSYCRSFGFNTRYNEDIRTAYCDVDNCKKYIKYMNPSLSKDLDKELDSLEFQIALGRGEVHTKRYDICHINDLCEFFTTNCSTTEGYANYYELQN